MTERNEDPMRIPAMIAVILCVGACDGIQNTVPTYTSQGDYPRLMPIDEFLALANVTGTRGIPATVGQNRLLNIRQRADAMRGDVISQSARQRINAAIARHAP